jgi:SPP1 gp7 family putative phage head morphogenesis protein
MANAAEKVADAMTRHGIDLLRVEAALRTGVTARLNDLERELVERIKKIEPNAPSHIRFRNMRVEKLVEAANDAFGQVYSDIDDELEEELTELAVVESRNVIKTLTGVLGAAIAIKVLSKAEARDLVRQTLIEGAQGRRWWAKQDNQMRFEFERRVREASMQGQALPDVLSSIRGTRAAGYNDGVTARMRRDATTLARTAFTSAVSMARMATYQKNADIIRGVQWLSVLDNRTSDICKALDGQAWTLEGEKLPGTVHDFLGPPPAHFNCRSTLIPVLKSWDELNATSSREVRRRLKRAKLSHPVRTSLDGKLSGDMTYEQWLSKKDSKNPKMVRGILGPSRYTLWKEDKLKFTDLIDQSWNPLTVAELKRKVRRK